MKAGRFATAAALFVLVVGIAVPAAFASSPDAVARYVASQRQAGDVIDRWLAVHAIGSSAQPTPVSDLESSLQVDRRAFAAQPSPVSDVASSLRVARGAAAVELATAKSGSPFAWQDAGIGAGAALLLVALGMSSLTLVRRHRQLAA